MKKEKYVPFEWQDRNLLKNRWVKPNYDDKEYLITGFEYCNPPYVDRYYDDYYEMIPHVIIGDVEISFKALFDDYVFDDDTPCGKLKTISATINNEKKFKKCCTKGEYSE